MADFGALPTGENCPALIVGAGPTGLTLALALRRLGVECRVVDAGEGPRAEPRAAVVWPREAELLAALGLGPRLLAASSPLGATAVFRGRRRLGELPFEGVASAFARPLVIEQHVLQGLLEAELQDAGGKVEWRTRLTAFTQTDRSVYAELAPADGSADTVKASWLVACDGARSGVRKRLGVTFVGRAVPNLEVVQVKARLDWPYEPDRGGLFLAPGRALGAFPMPDGRRRFYCFKTVEEPDRTSAPSLQEMQALIGGMMGRPPVELSDVDWLSRARFQERIAERLRVGRVLLAGDAAHVWPAVGGHGMAVAILGACNLAWRLAAVINGQGPLQLLDVYGDEQRTQAATMTRKMRLDLLERPLPGPVLAVLAAVLPWALKSAFVRRAIERGLLSDLNLGHRGGPMSVSRAGGPLRAGDRLPDAAVVVEGREQRLHGLLSVQHWTLIAPPGADVERIAPMLAGRAAIQMVQTAPAGRQAAADLDGLRAMLLVRPDGYVGLTARPNDLDALAAYLSAWLPQSADYSRENLCSWEVMNSRSAGTPASFWAMPRLIAGTMSSTRETRSP